ncbi:MAG: nicotinate-nucleotide--dimethylbenzimidazole phosphoribosyltransferase [Chloroflexi bacterium]|nr:nicotinate-nucleotide--dimethylbenzimidazole phosphoribosyltransferase [Chloroflexota bacterium]
MRRTERYLDRDQKSACGKGEPRQRVAAGDHGVVAQGVTAYPQAVTAQMVENFLSGGAAVSVMARRAGVRLTVVDAGVATPIAPHRELRSLSLGRGTDDITQGPAMSREVAQRAVLEGIALARAEAEAGADLIGVGDMGIGNTTASSAIVAAMTGEPPQRTTGRGTGRTRGELQAKAEVVARALAVNRPDSTDPLGVLAKVGGFEIGVLAGVILGGALARRAVVLDGFITGAAALLACALSPEARHYLIASHRSAERGHRTALRHLGLKPLLDLGLRLGEGTGAVLAMGLVEQAAACLSDMATFAEAGVANRDDSSMGPP